MAEHVIFRVYCIAHCFPGRHTYAVLYRRIVLRSSPFTYHGTSISINCFLPHQRPHTPQKQQRAPFFFRSQSMLHAYTDNLFWDKTNGSFFFRSHQYIISRIYRTFGSWHTVPVSQKATKSPSSTKHQPTPTKNNNNNNNNNEYYAYQMIMIHFVLLQKQRQNIHHFTNVKKNLRIIKHKAFVPKKKKTNFDILYIIYCIPTTNSTTTLDY